MVHFQDSGFRYLPAGSSCMLYPRKYSGWLRLSQLERQIRSKAALKAHLVTDSSVRAERISSDFIRYLVSAGEIVHLNRSAAYGYSEEQYFEMI